jgi:peptidyl-prolyl cis-trans isomerase C
MRSRLALLLMLSTLGSVALACSGGDGGGTSSGGGDGPRVHGLTEEEAAQTLAKIGDREITVGQFAEEIANKGPFLRARYNSPERRRELLDQLVRFELLAQEADAQGFDDLPDVQRTRKQLMIQHFLQEEYEERLTPADITDEEVRAFYEAHPTEFHQPEQVRASHILFTSEANATRVLRQILASPSDVRLFRSLAEELNTDEATRDRFGDLGFFSRPEEAGPNATVPPEVATAAFSLTTIGAVSRDVIHSARGYHIVKLTGRRAALDRSLEEASRPIRHRLLRERRESGIAELVTRLRSEADVEEHLDLLSQIHLDIPEGSFPPTVDGHAAPIDGPSAEGLRGSLASPTHGTDPTTPATPTPTPPTGAH